MVWKVMMVSLAGGILCLDRIFPQVMISRPVVAGPLVGWILNDPYTGFLCGALIELLWIDRLPIGTYIPPNDTITTVIITAAAIIAGSHLGQPSRELTVLAFLPLGYAGQQLDTWMIRLNDRSAKSAVSLADSADVRGIERLHLQALGRSFVLSVVVICTAVTTGSWMLIGVFPMLPPFVHKALTLSYFFIPLLGIAVALTTIKRKGAISLFCAAFAAMLIIWEWTYGFSK
jgi:PTS system mannose-specific IIC component